MRSTAKALLATIRPASVIVTAVFLFAAAVSAQQKLEPVPDTIKVAEQPESPVQIATEAVHPTVGNVKFIGYTFRNRTTKMVRSIVLRNDLDPKMKPVILGVPGTLVNQLGYQSGLEGGESRVLTFLMDLDGKPQVTTTSVDFVLFGDGTTWGPDIAGESERLLGIFDGQKRFVSEVKKFVASKDDVGLTALIMRDGLPPEQVGVENRTKRQIGIGTGYYAARLSLRSDLLGRGDLTGVPARIRDIELDLGLVPLPDDKRKQVTVQYGFGAPVRLTGFSAEGRDRLFDERFSVEGDWLTGFRVRISNDSGKTVKFVSIGIHFPETLRTGVPLGSNMYYGPHPITEAETEGQPRIAPGETFFVAVSDKFPGSLKRFLETRQPFDSISRVFINISYIEFEDETKWSGGQWWKKDPDKPGRWMPIK